MRRLLTLILLAAAPALATVTNDLGRAADVSWETIPQGRLAVWPVAAGVVYSPASDFSYSTNASQITILGYIGAGGWVSIPPTINGFPVVALDAAAFYSGSGWTGGLATSVILPDSMATVGGAAFAYCTLMTNVVFGSGVTSIGWNGLLGCDGLAAIKFKGNAPNISGQTFPAGTVYRTTEATGFGTPPDTFGGLPTAYWTP